MGGSGQATGGAAGGMSNGRAASPRPPLAVSGHADDTERWGYVGGGFREVDQADEIGRLGVDYTG